MPGQAPPPTPSPRAATSSRDSIEATQRRGLLDAQRAINSDLALDEILERIIKAACELVGAKYGAVGVLGPEDRLEQFVHHGMPEEIVRKVGALPTGTGLRGVLIEHPSMTAFLGVPIRVRDEVLGDIYLRHVEQGSFTEAERELLTVFAETAGTAINNARLYEDARRSRDWLHASGEITRALLADVEGDAMLDVVSRALFVAEADFVALILPTDDGLMMQAVVAAGVGGEKYSGTRFDPQSSELARVLTCGESILINDIARLTPDGCVNEPAYGPLMIAPLVDAKGLRGSVVLMRCAGNAPFNRRDLDLATTFADQVALSLEMDDTRDDAEQLQVLEVRHRIAEDLHDNVMQRLFATGMGLQGLARAALPTALSDRLGRHITDLDDTIDEIRERVFGLRDQTFAVPRRVRVRFPHVSRPDTTPTADAVGGEQPED